MTVYDFCSLAIDDYCHIIVFDFAIDEEVFNGTAEEAKMSDFENYEICSFDTPVNGTITLNIDTDM